ncbi:hypothetical protein BCR44DRAFT_37186 [Catenaria anguillulae PL171]|uniref:Uncharacterized protein n=1 Tax=Catenaria anguillulae PL171 TaxID=765915 RepID=A0A1Y2H500_9FUNG|nr:hypothetical protein BCR44DRAFT_37186 [Catenaria anguillulae PL171]
MITFAFIPSSTPTGHAHDHNRTETCKGSQLLMKILPNRLDEISLNQPKCRRHRPSAVPSAVPASNASKAAVQVANLQDLLPSELLFHVRSLHPSPAHETNSFRYEDLEQRSGHRYYLELSFVEWMVAWLVHTWIRSLLLRPSTRIGTQMCRETFHAVMHQHRTSQELDGYWESVNRSGDWSSESVERMTRWMAKAEVYLFDVENDND